MKRLALIAYAVLIILVSVGTASATTAPQTTLIDSVVLTTNGTRLSFTSVPRGDLVVFKVHNANRAARRFVIVPSSVGTGPAQGGGGFKTKLLKPGALTTFQIEFSVRGSFRYTVRDSANRVKAVGTFRVT